MIRAIRSEYRKLTSTSGRWILLLILVGYVGFTAALLAGLFGALGEQLAGTQGAPQLDSESLPPIIYSTTTAIGYVFPLILGVLVVTSEFRHQTLTPTFLATPRRWRVLAAKLVVLFGAGAVYGVAGVLGSVGLGAPILALTGNDAAIDSGETWLLLARIVIAMAIWAVVGAGIGALIPNQIAAIVVVLAFTQFVEPILRFAASIWAWTADVGKFLPGAASDALVGASFYTTLSPAAATATLEWWQGGLVLIGIATTFAAAGALTSWRKDVT